MGLLLLLTNGLLNEAVKPVGVAATAVTVRPRTAMAALVPVRPALAVSVAVMVRLPLVFSVALKVPAPLVRVVLGGLPEVVPAVGLVAKGVAAGPRTAMAALVPVMELVTRSVAVTVWLPAVLRVALKEPAPPVRVLLAGRTAWASLLLKWTVP